MARVTSLLAQGPGLPEGDTETGLALQLCLNAQAGIDGAAFDVDPLPWPVRRFWPDRDPWAGELVRAGDGWALAPQTSDDDQPLWDIEARVLRPGEYITLRRPGGEELIFRVVSVDAD